MTPVIDGMNILRTASGVTPQGKCLAIIGCLSILCALVCFLIATVHYPAPKWIWVLVFLLCVAGVVCYLLGINTTETLVYAVISEQTDWPELVKYYKYITSDGTTYTFQLMRSAAVWYVR